MKISLSIFLSFLILICSCNSYIDNDPNKFSLHGEINGQDSGIVVVGYMSDSIYIYDSIRVKNGKFNLIGRILEPTMATIRDGNDLELAVVYLEPQKMKIAIFNDRLLRCNMTGSKTQNEFASLNKMEEAIYERLLILKEQSQNINDSLKISKDGPAKLLLEKKGEAIDSIRSQTRDELYPMELKFVLENPKSFVSSNYLHKLFNNEFISLDSVKTIFNGLDSSIQNSRYGKLIIEDIRKKENIRIGNQAPDFKATDLNEQVVTLSQFKGNRLVLLDFWASWCVPCRKNLPHVKAVYEKYHLKGLEVIAVSVDEKRNSWIEAIKQDGINKWHNILIAEKWPIGPWTNDDIYQNYYYNGIPYQ
jgi:thiol-disulfide isomerase/thioredoxin